MNKAVLFASALSVLGCGGKKEETPKATPSTPATAPATGDCATRAAKLETELRELATTRPGFLPLVQGIDAPSAKGAQPTTERGWVIAVARDGSVSVQGHRFDKTDSTSVIEDVRSYTDSMFKVALEKHVMGGGSGRDLSIPLYLWVDRNAPASLVAELVAYANPEGPWPPRAKTKPTGDDPPPLLDDPPPPEEDEDPSEARKQAIEAAKQAGILGKPGDTPPPRRVPIRLLVASDGAPPPATSTLPPSEPASTTKLVEQLKAAVGACAPIITTMGTASLEGVPAKEAAVLAKDIPAGLVSCGCKGDVDALSAGMRTWFGASAPRLSWIAVPPLDPKDTRTIGAVVTP
jgi:hypothetical protein